MSGIYDTYSTIYSCFDVMEFYLRRSKLLCPMTKYQIHKLNRITFNKMHIIFSTPNFSQPCIRFWIRSSTLDKFNSIVNLILQRSKIGQMQQSQNFACFF